jgi:hypothetical protein
MSPRSTAGPGASRSSTSGGFRPPGSPSRTCSPPTASRRWTDYLIQPNGGRFLPGSTVGFLWEIYNLTADSSGMARYDVELRITVEAIERRSLFAQIVGGVADATGLSAVGDDRVSLNWSRSAAVGPEGVVTEHVEVELRDAPEGRYTVSVTVGDRGTGAVAVSERMLLVLRDPPARPQEYDAFR